MLLNKHVAVLKLNVYLRFPSSEFAEKITTSTGETMGGFETTTPNNTHGDIGRVNKTNKRIIVDVDSALRAREGNAINASRGGNSYKKKAPSLSLNASL